MHPLNTDLSALTDAELHKKHGELISRLNKVRGANSYGIIMQLQMLLDDYNTEIRRRNDKVMEELMKKSQGKKPGGIIDIT